MTMTHKPLALVVLPDGTTATVTAHRGNWVDVMQADGDRKRTDSFQASQLRAVAS